MGCCTSSPHSGRRFRDPADLDEVIVPLRYFSTNRPGSVMVPDEVLGLPSTHIEHHLASDCDPILYEAEIDQGQAFRCFRPAFACLCTPWGIIYLATKGISGRMCAAFTCDAACCWVRKEYSTRTFFRIYSNRIEINLPTMRVPFGFLGCGSWVADNILTHPFDRGAFGFRRVHCCVINYLCCAWPVYGGAVARQRCQCNGPVWNRMFTDCGGWWCDEWPCDMLFCSYRYYGLADADEVAFAASVCLQSYYEGRVVSPSDVKRCVEYWQQNISEAGGGPVREVCCEPHCKFPCITCSFCYENICHPRRKVPYKGEAITKEVEEVYHDYNGLRLKQIEKYKTYHGPVRSSTFCKKAGCRRFFGRKGCFFCTEGCNSFDRKGGDPAPAFESRDFDDENDASVVLRRVLGAAPANVVYKRWEYTDKSPDKAVLVTYPSEIPDQEDKLHGS